MVVTCVVHMVLYENVGHWDGRNAAKKCMGGYMCLFGHMVVICANWVMILIWREP